MAKWTSRSQVVVVVSSAVAECNDVLDIPILASADLALADVASAIVSLEYPQGALLCHCPAFGVLEAGAGHSSSHSG